MKIGIVALMGVLAGLVSGCDSSGNGGSDSDVNDDGGPQDSGQEDGDVEDDGGDETCLNGNNESMLDETCNCHRDCVESTVCATEAENGVPGGQCTRLCTSTGDECGAGFVCYTLIGDDEGLCRRACDTHDDCREGWACFYGSCGPTCTSDEHCLSGHCNEYQSLCYDGGELEGGGVLDPCLRDEDCLSGACMTEIGGHCIGFCVVPPGTCPENTICAVGLGLCPDDAVCMGNIDPVDELVGVCMTTCEGHSDCPGDLECFRTDIEGANVCWRPSS